MDPVSRSAQRPAPANPGPTAAGHALGAGDGEPDGGRVPCASCVSAYSLAEAGGRVSLVHGHISVLQHSVLVGPLESPGNTTPPTRESDLPSAQPSRVPPLEMSSQRPTEHSKIWALAGPPGSLRCRRWRPSPGRPPPAVASPRNRRALTDVYTL